MWNDFYSRFGKRLLDLILSVLALVLLTPVLAVLTLLTRVLLGTPVIFLQQRPGLDGKFFTMYKFRSMRDVRDDHGNLLPDADRLTSFGRFLRGTSLDELPELVNVLKGEMSLIGPRPLLIQYLDRYTPEQRRRHAVRPGITGWAQIQGRNDTTWEKRFELDLWYVDHCSLGLDCRIMLRTFWILFRDDTSIEMAWQLGEYMGPDKTPNYSGTISDEKIMGEKNDSK